MGGIIYRCSLSTLCDAMGDWTTSYDTTETDIYSLAVDSTNGVLYAGTSGGGIIYRCALSTSCDAAGDWTTSYDTTEASIYSLAVDSTNGVLYAGSDTNGIIYHCLLSTGCDSAGDWTTSYDTSETYIYSLSIEPASGVVYAGSGNNGIIYKTDPTWNLSVPGTRSVSYARVKDSHACTPAGDITTSNSTDAGGNTCWTFSAAGPTLTLSGYRFRADDGTESEAPYLVAEDTDLTNTLRIGDRTRLRLSIANTGSAAATNIAYSLEYASSSCTLWRPVGEYTPSSGDEWLTELSPWVGNGNSTSDSAGLSNPAEKSFVSGEFRSFNRKTNPHGLTTGQFSEFEYALRSSSLVSVGVVYCFRVTDDGVTTYFSYPKQPKITLIGTPRPQAGGRSIELPPSAILIVGGTPAAGNAPIDTTGSGSQQTGGGAGGGGDI
jgi:hypothetical protein